MNFLFILYLLILPNHTEEAKPVLSEPFSIISAPKLSATQPKIIMHGSRKEKRLALTFDACATNRKSKYDSAVVDILVKEKIPATFFLCGRWALDHPNETKFLASHDFFEIASHSYLHPHCTKLTPEAFTAELKKTQDIIFTLTKKQPLYFRAPYGEYDSSMLSTVATLGLTSVEYDLPSGDPDKNATAKKLIDYVSACAKNGSIIVMHVNKRGWHTAEALPEMISRLRKRGFTFVTISGLIQ
ncbi:MAG: polysaccharide deacetylase family protein [Bacteroidetes bacterium]|nr:polysaccharide deacetylase family protein [Bacteroidota bacterium]